jgi:hypothetical protein
MEMRATSERIERTPAAQRSLLKQYFADRKKSEGMELQFFDDGTGLMTLDNNGNTETHSFRWSSEDRILSKRIGVISSEMEYEVSSSRLLLINHNEDGGIIRELWRVR